MTVFQGIAERDVNLATKYVNPEKYVEHNPRAADGGDGLRECIGRFSKEGHDLKVVKAFQVGSYVFAQGDGQTFIVSPKSLAGVNADGQSPAMPRRSVRKAPMASNA